MPRRPTVTLLFRKTRAVANFSIETSFDRMIASFPPDGGFRLEKFVSSYYSNGIVPRVKGILEARRHPSDLYHVTGDVHYLTLGLPGTRTILTIHDLVFLRHPDRLTRRILKWFWLDLPVRHCRAITAVSEATRREILQHTRCAPDKVRVIPTIIGDRFEPQPRKFDDQTPRVLHIGLAANKNFDRHVRALAGTGCRLHVIGKLGPHHEALLREAAVDYTWEYNIPDEAVRRAYADSDLVLFASTLEGFGMPIVEAQSIGRPVVTSNISSMPEVAGRGACLVDPHDVESIRSGVRRVIGDPAYRETLVREGFENVKRFTAERVARQYGTLYEEIHGRPPDEPGFGTRPPGGW